MAHIYFGISASDAHMISMYNTNLEQEMLAKSVLETWELCCASRIVNIEQGKNCHDSKTFSVN